MRIYSRKTKALFESLRSAKTKYPNIPKTFFEEFVRSDKSGTYKYVEKMCEFFYDGYNWLSIASNMEKYQKLEAFVDDKDITHKTYQDILNDIENAELRKLNSNKERRMREKAQGLIYDKDNIKIYAINTYSDAVSKGKGTKWCIALNEDKFDFYIKQYNIYFIFDLNRKIDDPFRKICYLNGLVEDTFVDKENIHYFESNKEYSEIKEYFGKDIMNIMI